MKPKIKLYPNGWTVYASKGPAFYGVTIRTAKGDIHDRVRCDQYRSAMGHYKIFCNIARNA
jgi:hypothetical protein